MGLKFRRGTTAQQSGSLAFGEPYVNTTLGTLVIGGQSGDIVLSSGGTGSTGNFGAISGSGLDITGNANIAGNLTLGGAITIGDASADTVNVIASVSSSLIPSVTNAFDLGSETKIWRDLYISTGSIKFVGTGGAIVGTLSNSGNGMALDGGVITRGDSTFGTSSLAVTSVTGSLRVSGSNSFIGTQNINGNINLTGSILPGVTNTYDLGSPTKQFRHLYISTGSLYMNGTAILSSNATDLTLTTDNGQSLKLLETAADTITLQTAEGNLTLTSTGAGDVILDPTTGVVSIKGTLQIQDGNKITSSGGNTIQFGNNVAITGSLITTTGLTVGGDFVVNGTTTTIDSTNINIGDNIIVLNGTLTTNGGMYVKDAAGGNTATGSMLWDTTNDKWIAGPKGSELGILRTGGDGVVSGSAQIDGSLLGSNKTITIGSTSTTLGGTSTTIAGLTSVTSTAFVGALTGNASTVTTNANLTGNVTSVGNATTIASGVVTSDMIVDGTIVNGDINASAAIVDTKLATISTGGKVSNSATTATSANTNSAIVARDGSGNFSAGTITAALTGNASTATALATTRAINGVNFDGSAAITVTANTTNALTIGTGLSGTSFNGSAAITIANTGVTSNVASTGISVSGATGAVTITNTGVTSNVAGTGVTVSGATGAVTISIGQAVATTDNVRFNSLGIGMAASATAGRIDATNDIVAFSSSDIRFKENITPIENALDKISKISGNTYDWKAENKAEHGYEGNDVGVIAQEIEAVLPQLVQTRENGYKAVKYDKLVALLIQGIKEQQLQIEELKAKIGL